MASADPRSPDFDPRLLNGSADPRSPDFDPRVAPAEPTSTPQEDKPIVLSKKDKLLKIKSDFDNSREGEGVYGKKNYDMPDILDKLVIRNIVDYIAPSKKVNHKQYREDIKPFMNDKSDPKLSRTARLMYMDSLEQDSIDDGIIEAPLHAINLANSATKGLAAMMLVKKIPIIGDKLINSGIISQYLTQPAAFGAAMYAENKWKTRGTYFSDDESLASDVGMSVLLNGAISAVAHGAVRIGGAVKTGNALDLFSPNPTKTKVIKETNIKQKEVNAADEKLQAVERQREDVSAQRHGLSIQARELNIERAKQEIKSQEQEIKLQRQNIKSQGQKDKLQGQKDKLQGQKDELRAQEIKLREQRISLQEQNIESQGQKDILQEQEIKSQEQLAEQLSLQKEDLTKKEAAIKKVGKEADSQIKIIVNNIDNTERETEIELSRQTVSLQKQATGIFKEMKSEVDKKISNVSKKVMNISQGISNGFNKIMDTVDKSINKQYESVFKNLDKTGKFVDVNDDLANVANIINTAKKKPIVISSEEANARDGFIDTTEKLPLTEQPPLFNSNESVNTGKISVSRQGQGALAYVEKSPKEVVLDFLKLGDPKAHAIAENILNKATNVRGITSETIADGNSLKKLKILDFKPIKSEHILRPDGAVKVNDGNAQDYANTFIGHHGAAVILDTTSVKDFLYKNAKNTKININESKPYDSTTVAFIKLDKLRPVQYNESIAALAPQKEAEKAAVKVLANKGTVVMNEPANYSDENVFQFLVKKYGQPSKIKGGNGFYWDGKKIAEEGAETVKKVITEQKTETRLSAKDAHQLKQIVQDIGGMENFKDRFTTETAIGFMQAGEVIAEKINALTFKNQYKNISNTYSDLKDAHFAINQAFDVGAKNQIVFGADQLDILSKKAANGEISFKDGVDFVKGSSQQLTTLYNFLSNFDGGKLKPRAAKLINQVYDAVKLNTEKTHMATFIKEANLIDDFIASGKLLDDDSFSEASIQKLKKSSVGTGIDYSKISKVYEEFRKLEIVKGAEANLKKDRDLSIKNKKLKIEQSLNKADAELDAQREELSMLEGLYKEKTKKIQLSDIDTKKQESLTKKQNLSIDLLVEKQDLALKNKELSLGPKELLLKQQDLLLKRQLLLLKYKESLLKKQKLSEDLSLEVQDLSLEKQDASLKSLETLYRRGIEDKTKEIEIAKEKLKPHMSMKAFSMLSGLSYTASILAHSSLPYAGARAIKAAADGVTSMTTMYHLTGINVLKDAAEKRINKLVEFHELLEKSGMLKSDKNDLIRQGLNYSILQWNKLLGN